MRTTLDIDDDVLFAAKELAAKERKTAGKVLSEFFRRAIHADGVAVDSIKSNGAYPMRNGIPLLPSRGEVVSSEHIQRLMEEEGV